ncbi:unnamed protein product, partial [Prorocentrum cordatum]
SCWFQGCPDFPTQPIFVPFGFRRAQRDAAFDAAPDVGAGARAAPASRRHLFPGQPGRARPGRRRRGCEAGRLPGAPGGARGARARGRARLRRARGAPGRRHGRPALWPGGGQRGLPSLRFARGPLPTTCKRSWPGLRMAARGWTGAVWPRPSWAASRRPSSRSACSWTSRWVDWDFWDLCTLREPTPALRSVRTRTGHDLEILRESPMVASVRGFASEAECQELAGAAQTRGLAMDPVVSGCAASRERLRADREMFSTSLRVNWRVEDTLSSLAARSFDLASDMLDVDVPMNEGQEKIKLYHYIKGFEHRPHHDGARTQRGSDSNEWRRVATTLIYCEAAEEGGATVFTGGPSTYLPKSMKFRPRRGDILFFAYDPDPEFEATYAECPVLEGNKTTLAQWYRPGVPGAPSWSGSPSPSTTGAAAAGAECRRQTAAARAGAGRRSCDGQARGTQRGRRCGCDRARAQRRSAAGGGDDGGD